MPLEDLPNGWVSPTRPGIRDQFQRDMQLRQPGVPTGEGSQAFIDGSVMADTLMPLYANAASIGRGANLRDMTRAHLKEECLALGIPEELPATPGFGFAEIVASAGGVFIPADRECKDEATQLRFRCAVADTYFHGQPVPVIGIDTGPTTNLAPGARLKWSNPPAGLGSIATVLADPNGDGFTGGRIAETDDDIISRIIATRADPPTGGNASHVRTLVKQCAIHVGVPVQEVFVYPAITGAGHYAYCFTLRPGKAGGSRIPTALQIAAVLAFITGALPHDDGIFASTILEDAITAKLGIEWMPGAQGWVDASPWPPAADNFHVTTPTSATTFDVKSDEPVSTAPAVGKTFAFYDKKQSKFVRKRILSAVALGAGEYTLTIDTSNNASDPNYKPAVDEEFCPWSPSLDLLAAPLLTEFDTLGPSEQEEDFFDDGYRQRRDPPDPASWPIQVRHNSLDAVDDLPQIADVTWLSPSIPYTPAVGVPGVSSNLVVIGTLLAFPI